jgi:hypothetical protein
MAIPYRTAKFKSANILAIAILGSTAKFNSRQYFRLYGTLLHRGSVLPRPFQHSGPPCLQCPYLPHAHAQGGKVIGFVVVVSTKIAISGDLGI